MSIKSMKNLPKKSIDDLFQARFDDKFHSHYPLSSVLPINIGGVCRAFITAKTTADLVDAAKIAIENKLPYVVIGIGTAVLVGESGFSGLVIKNNTTNVFKVGESSRIVCDAGVNNFKLINSMATIGLGGMEFLYSIPGTIGGAVVSDAQSEDRSILDYIKEVSLFNADDGAVTTVDKATFRQLRKQIFSGSLVYPTIILTVTLQFAQLAQDEIIRRLSVNKRNSNQLKNRSFGYVFSRKLTKININRNTQKQLKALNVSYDKLTDTLTINNSCTPWQLRKAIELISNIAKGFGIETSEKITYLGYYQEENDGNQNSNTHHQGEDDK